MHVSRHESSASGVHPRGLPVLVLVVDDDADLRELTARILSLNGYAVIEADHGGAAMGRLAEYVPDLVILDLQMPVMDGWAFRAAQKQLTDERLTAIPVLLLTGAEHAAQHEKALDAAGLVQKPFEPETLLDAVDAALRRCA